MTKNKIKKQKIKYIYIYSSTFNVINGAGEFSVATEVQLWILWEVGSLVTNNTIFYFLYIFFFFLFLFSFFSICFLFFSIYFFLFYFLITYGVCKKRKYCNRMSKKKISPFDKCSWFVCLRRQNKQKKISVCLSVCLYVRGLFMWRK